jgi:hypothetical protein
VKFSRRFLLGAGAASALPLPSWALKAGQFSAAEQATLVQLAFDLFPHPRLTLETYQRVANGLIATPLPAPRLKAWKDGLAALESGSSIPWRRRKRALRTLALRTLQTRAVFADWRASTAVALYHNPAVAAQLGFPGPSLPFGGYIGPKLNDAKWLAEPTP